MAVRAYADGVLFYDSRLDDYKLLALKTASGLNKGGTAEIKLPANHPAYNSFVGHKTIVEVYRDDLLKWRGRALYPTDDFYKLRTWTCEGERCFLRDATMRPYLFQDPPQNIFAAVVETYNTQVSADRQFKLGTCDIVDANDYVRLENQSAEQVLDTIDKLVERCGGYITFTTNAHGERVINWLTTLNYANNQAIEFGENLLDYARTDANTDLVTVVIPYGAQTENEDGTAGPRITIESVNDGFDFIQDDAAVALRGPISRPVYWDDVTEPGNLLRKAQQYLNEKKNAITTLALSAVDLADLGQNFDTFQVGDLVKVTSAPHQVDDYFLLKERTEDWLNPAGGTVTLGKELSSLTGADAAGDKQTLNELHRVEQNIRSEYQTNTPQLIKEAKLTLESLISQTAEAIKLEVSETYATADGIESIVATKMEQLADSFNFQFETLENVNDQLVLIEKYIRFVDGKILIGEQGHELELRIENDIIRFLDNGAEVAYLSNRKLFVTDAEILHSIIIGNIGIVPRKNGNTSIVRIKQKEAEANG